MFLNYSDISHFLAYLGKETKTLSIAYLKSFIDGVTKNKIIHPHVNTREDPSRKLKKNFFFLFFGHSLIIPVKFRLGSDLN